MRHAILVLRFILVTALAIGCTSTYGKAAAEERRSQTVAAQNEKAEAEAKEAAPEMQDYTYAQKAEFVEKMKKELVGIQKELDRLSAKVDRSNSETKADAKAKLEMVREKWNEANNQLDQAERATESTWDDVKNSFRMSCRELKDSLEKSCQWVSKKIEP